MRLTWEAQGRRIGVDLNGLVLNGSQIEMIGQNKVLFWYGSMAHFSKDFCSFLLHCRFSKHAYVFDAKTNSASIKWFVQPDTVDRCFSGVGRG